MTEIMFTIPHRLVRLNEYIRAERGNKYAAASIKEKMTDLCRYYIPKLKEPLKGPIDITYIWTVKNFASDEDNVSFARKFINDAMQKVGFIRNDNLTVIRETHHKFVKGNGEKVTLIVKGWRDESLYKSWE